MTPLLRAFAGRLLPPSLWRDGVLHLPKALTDAHRAHLDEHGWLQNYAPVSAGSIGGASEEDANDHVVNRFLNSAARMQYVCTDPLDEQVEVRDAVLDQLAEGRIHIIDLAAGNGAGTISMLSIVCELRRAGLIPQLPLNVCITAIDFSPASLNHFAALLEKISPWLAGAGMFVELNLCHCDLTIVGEFSETLDGFFSDAQRRGVNRFICMISAISGAKKDGVEQMVDSLKHAAARLSHSRKSSSWLWVEPHIGKPWFIKIADVVRLTLTKIRHKFSPKGETFLLSANVPMLNDPACRCFNWSDPHNKISVQSRVVVLAFRNR